MVMYGAKRGKMQQIMVGNFILLKRYIPFGKAAGETPALPVAAQSKINSKNYILYGKI